MAGGIIQLIAYGPQDIYLTNNPHITYFKVVYRRHTNFSIQQFEAPFDDKPTFGKKASIKLFRLGDLATRMYIRVVLGDVPRTPGTNFAWIRRLGYFMFNELELSIGGQTIDKHFGHWLNIWYELARKDKQDRGYKKNIGDVDELTAYNDLDKPQYIMNIPLEFFFNRHFGLALPLIAIRYHEIYIKVTLEERERLIIRDDNFTDFDSLRILQMSLVTDYIYLDLEERRRFTENRHEYLIEQVQYLGEVGVEKYEFIRSLDFKHPVKELIWAMNNGNYTSGKKFLFYSNKDDWTNEINRFSRTILEQSILILNNENNDLEEPPELGDWEKFPSNTSSTSSTQSLKVINNNSTKNIWINVASIKIGDYNITRKINAEIVLSSNNILNIFNIDSEITTRDLSYPVEVINDTRVNVTTDVYVCQYHNYGLYISGEENPFVYASLEYNGQPRFEEMNGLFFGVLQPYRYHSNTPATGINLYSFADQPEILQPTGASNMSEIETIYLKIGLNEAINETNEPTLDLLNLENRLYVYTFSYNIFRVMSGMAGIRYNE